MPTLWIVEHLNVVKDIATGFFSCVVGFSADALAFKQLEEALGDGIVMAVSAPMGVWMHIHSLTTCSFKPNSFTVREIVVV